MTVLISVFAAVITTALWYFNQPQNSLRLGILCWMFWGASLMWFVDAIYEYAEQGASFFSLEYGECLQDVYLGLSVVALALVVWIFQLLVKDPKNIMRTVFFRQADEAAKNVEK